MNIYLDPGRGRIDIELTPMADIQPILTKAEVPDDYVIVGVSWNNERKTITIHTATVTEAISEPP